MTIFSSGRVIAGVDPSPHAARAARWGAREAAERGMPLHLVHALDLPDSPDLLMPESFLAAAHANSTALLKHVTGVVQDEFPGLAVTASTSDLGVAETLIELGGPEDILVTGARGQGGFAGLLLGSVSLKIAAHARCPVIVVRGGTDGVRLRNEVVLGVEENTDAAPIRFAFDSCRRLGARLLVVRTWPSAPSYVGHRLAEVLADDREHLLDTTRLIKPFRDEFPSVEVSIEAIRGNAVPRLIDAAREARLLVIGARRGHTALSPGIGHVTHGLLSHAETPVAVVPVR